MSAAKTKFSAMHLPRMKPVWLGSTISGISFCSLFVRVLPIALSGQFCREIGLKGVRCCSVVVLWDKDHESTVKTIKI
jgi:hypothetical protein